MKNILNYINGEFVKSSSGKTLQNICPSDGQVYSELPRSSKADIGYAVKSAQNAFLKWSNTELDKRAKVMLRIADLIEEDLENLARAESIDNGKPLNLARSVDIPRAASNFRFFAHALTQFHSESHENQGLKNINFTLRKALGVVGCISPWNLPLYLLTWKIAPALAAGNCVVAKPSEVTPMTAYLLCEICRKAGLQDGVLNIIHGLGQEAGQALIEHPDVKAISFTGGTETGKQIAKTAAPMFKKLSLELGGKNPNIIFEDCNYEKMMATTLKSSFANQGQICLCGSRIFIEHTIYEKFKEDFVERVKSLKIGHPTEDDFDLGAIVSKQHLDKVMSFIDKAKTDKNMTILYGGNQIKLEKYPDGNFLIPCIIEVQDNNCDLNQQEIFGPVVSLMPFKTEEEALELANNTPYGLSATVWTQNLNRSMRLSQKLETGIVWINTWLNRDLRTPFGGTKQSGVGREGGFEALRFFTEPKNICIDFNDK